MKNALDALDKIIFAFVGMEPYVWCLQKVSLHKKLSTQFIIYSVDASILIIMSLMKIAWNVLYFD